MVVPLEKRGEVFDAFRSISRGTGPVRIKSDGCMFEEYAPGKYLAGYAVKREPSLMALNRRLLSYREYRKSDKREFHPHITLLFDDLTREAFRDFQESISEDRIQLPGAIGWEASEFGLYYYVPGKSGDAGSWIPEEIIPLRA